MHVHQLEKQMTFADGAVHQKTSCE